MEPTFEAGAVGQKGIRYKRVLPPERHGGLKKGDLPTVSRALSLSWQPTALQLGFWAVYTADGTGMLQWQSSRPLARRSRADPTATIRHNRCRHATPPGASSSPLVDTARRHVPSVPSRKAWRE